MILSKVSLGRSMPKMRPGEGLGGPGPSVAGMAAVWSAEVAAACPTLTPSHVGEHLAVHPCCPHPWAGLCNNGVHPWGAGLPSSGLRELSGVVGAA